MAQAEAAIVQVAVELDSIYVSWEKRLSQNDDLRRLIP
jgi:hypothetical protein